MNDKMISFNDVYSLRDHTPEGKRAALEKLKLFEFKEKP
jgi:hypothetical protein